MRSEWKQRRFGDLCDITRGGSPRPIHDFIRNEGIPWVKISDATSSGSRFIKETSQFIKPEGKSKSREVFPGDLIVSNSATPGIPRFMDIYACVHDGWLLLRNFRELDKEFCFYLIEQEKPALLLQGNGSVFTNLKTDILKNHRVFLPPIHEQKYIARILGALDDKIELNRQMNITLEAMAQTLFKSWFVEFDPVIDNALAAGNPIPESFQAHAETRKSLGDQRKSLPDDLQQQFPDRFVQTDEMGWVPEGWKIGKLGNYVSVKRGGSPRPIQDYLVDTGLPWVKISDATASASRFIMRTRGFIKPEGLKKTVLLKKGELILSNSATPGLPKFLDLDACIHDGWLYFPKKHFFKDFYLYQLFLVVREELRMQGNGSVFTNLKTDILKNHLVLLPLESLMNRANCQFESIHQKSLSLQTEIDCLQKLRDYLLPKLLSGEVTVPEAESIIDKQLAEA